MAAPSSDPASLGEAAYRELHAGIISCRFAPGRLITERSLADSTGFGISPIRDALTRLSHDGLVRTLPRKGYQVTPLTLKSVDDLFTLWRIVGPESVRLGVRDATEEQTQEIVAAFSAALPDGSPASGKAGKEHQLGWVEQVGAAFGLLVEATDNDYLIRIQTRLQNDIIRLWALIQTDTSVPEPPVTTEWLEIIKRRDGDAAAAYVRDYIADWHARVLRILSRWPSVVTSEITPLIS
ncbi:GntR family transcriptional regulator [Streptomyces sp. NPDC003832]